MLPGKNARADARETTGGLIFLAETKYLIYCERHDLFLGAKRLGEQIAGWGGSVNKVLIIRLSCLVCNRLACC